MKVLIGEISSYKAIVIATFLNKYYDNIVIYAYDHRLMCKNIKTKYVKKCFLLPSPQERLHEHLLALSSIIISNEIGVFIPVDSSMYGIYIQENKYLNNTFNYTSGFEIYDKLHNKAKLSQIADLLSIKMPKHFNNLSNAVCPFVVKPVNLSSSKGVRYVLSEFEKKYLIIKNEDLILQEYINGVGCGYSFFSRDGKIICGSGHLRLAEYPVTGGSSVYRQTFFLEQMKSIVTKIVGSINYSGFAMFEFKLQADGQLFLLEVNPRIWGSINQGLTNGVNYFESILGSASKPIKRKNLNTYLSPLLYISFFEYIIKGNFKPMLKFITNFYRNKPDISPIKDPLGYLSIIIRKIV